MEVKKKYIGLDDLEVYQLARKLSAIGWQIYESLSWQDKKTMGDQFIRSTDSVGANVAEGYGRYHYLDKIRFYYHSRGSYLETKKHWLELLHDRKKIDDKVFQEYSEVGKKFEVKLNNFITATFNSKQKFDNE